MVDQIPESLQASLDWYSRSFNLVQRVNKALSDIKLFMPTQGKRLELEIWGYGVLTYEWTWIMDSTNRTAVVVIRFELEGNYDATSLELHLRRKGDEKKLPYVGTFSSKVVELKIGTFDLKQEYTLSMAMPTVK
jgi:hypothetical protein